MWLMMKRLWEGEFMVDHRNLQQGSSMSPENRHVWLKIFIGRTGAPDI